MFISSKNIIHNRLLKNYIPVSYVLKFNHYVVRRYIAYAMCSMRPLINKNNNIEYREGSNKSKNILLSPKGRIHLNSCTWTLDKPTAFVSAAISAVQLIAMLLNIVVKYCSFFFLNLFSTNCNRSYALSNVFVSCCCL